MSTYALQSTPDVRIEKHAWRKMFGWCRAAESECSGYGLVKLVNGVFVVYDVFFPLQYCSSGYTEIDDLANHRLQDNLSRKKIDPTHYRFWWHTHYNFGTFWSGTDHLNAREQVKYNQEWEVSLVINQKGGYRCRVDYQTPFSGTFDECNVYTISNSRTQKRKRNFKTDVLRYVKTMEQMPDRQKPKFSNVNEGVAVTTPAYISPVNADTNRNAASYKEHDWETNWRSRWEERKVGDEKKEQTFLWGKHEMEKDAPLPPKEPIRFGRYILHEGRLITEDSYARMIATVKEPEACACGNLNCTNKNACLPCMICGSGRFQASSGYCPTCYQDLIEKENGYASGY